VPERLSFRASGWEVQEWAPDSKAAGRQDVDALLDQKQQMSDRPHWLAEFDAAGGRAAMDGVTIQRYARAGCQPEEVAANLAEDRLLNAFSIGFVKGPTSAAGARRGGLKRKLGSAGKRFGGLTAGKENWRGYRS